MLQRSLQHLTWKASATFISPGYVINAQRVCVAAHNARAGRVDDNFGHFITHTAAEI